MKLYKYMRIEHVTDALANGIYAGKLKELNDPYEYEGIRYVDDYRVCSLTKSPNKILMWAYYGMHKGCCIEFEVPDYLPFIKDVSYTTDYYQHREMDNVELLESLYTKAKEWEHENEVRIVFSEKDFEKEYWHKVHDKVFFKAKVTGIYFGLLTDFDSKSAQELMILLKEREGHNGIKISKCQISNRQYRIIWDRQFDYRREIKF